MDKDYGQISVSELASMIESKEISPVEVTESILSRIEKTDARINSYITVTSKEAKEQARAAEAAIKSGNYLGPLHGIPISLKDNIHTESIRTTNGAKIDADQIPNFDATITARLKAAGAVITGKVNMHEYAASVTTNNPHYGPTRNPWDLERIAGGSSGGSAAAVSANQCMASIGTDTGGSIRIPASLRGVVGLKPTYGLISKYGVTPLSLSLDHAGPITKTVRDAAVVLHVLAEFDPNDPDSREVSSEDYTLMLNSDLKGTRIGLPRNYYFENIDPEVKQCVESAIQDLKRIGCIIEEIELPNSRHSLTVTSTIAGVEAAVFHEENIKNRPSDFGFDVITWFQHTEKILASQYVKAQQNRNLIKNDFAQAFAKVDIICTPTLPTTAPKIGQEVIQYEDFEESVVDSMLRLNCPANVAGIPAITVPCGFSSNGLPIGLQIMGAPFKESKVLQVANAYETHFGLKYIPNI
ncbi:amidase [Brevibacillus sp. NRS-1366]|uniref:amidase n=1 Tax=Brevibacillus sp. NRS-1366 TaxID=3233899 RepID=UPI003D1A761E